jgi:hypothetical protein
MSIDRLFSISSPAMLIVLGVAACQPVSGSASVGFQPISPEELKMTSEPQAPGAPAIILFRKLDRDDNFRTPHEDNYFRIKILTEEGRKYADVEIPYLKESGSIGSIRARTIRPDGTVVNFEGKAFDKVIVKAKGVKYLAKTFTLPDVQVGSIIEYYYTGDLKENYLHDSHWILSHELFTKSAEFSLKAYQDAAGHTPYHLRWTSQAPPPGAPAPKQGPDRVIRLEANNIPAFQAEDFMPPADELKWRVDFIYSEGTPVADVDKFWIDTGKDLNIRLESFVGKRKAMERAVAEIVAPNDPPEVKLRKIYARVQQMRNTSYEVQKTEQEEKREKDKGPGSVEDVWKSGHGSGRQLTWLYLALVRAAGFEAYGVWASDRSNYVFNPRRMDSSRLNANVVLIKLNGKDIYSDPGSAFTPFGSLPWEETAAQGLRLDKDGGTWVTTPLPESSESRIERRASLKLSETGDLEGKLTVTFTGLEAMQRRVDERNVDEVERKQFLEGQVKESIPAGSEVELVNKPEWSSSAPALVAQFNLKVPGWASGAGHRELVPAGLFGASEKHLFDHATRVYPVYFEFPFEEVDDVVIEIPPGWQVTSLPPPQSELHHVVEYTLKVENDQGRLHLARMLNVDLLLLETKYYPALRNFFQVVRTADEEQIVLQPGTATAGK